MPPQQSDDGEDDNDDDDDVESETTADKFLVFRSNLMELFEKCPTCNHPSGADVKYTKGCSGLHPPRMFKVSVQPCLVQPALHEQDASWEPAAVWGHLQ